MASGKKKLLSRLWKLESHNQCQQGYRVWSFWRLTEGPLHSLAPCLIDVHLFPIYILFILCRSTYVSKYFISIPDILDEGPPLTPVGVHLYCICKDPCPNKVMPWTVRVGGVGMTSILEFCWDTAQPIVPYYLILLQTVISLAIAFFSGATCALHPWEIQTHSLNFHVQ